MNDANAYNLVDEPWIPVLMQDGSSRRVSLGAIFSDASGDIADLALTPYERVAVFRLLLCIAQAALGPDRLADESAWRAAQSAVGPAASAYLAKWHDRFFLYGPHAFLQPDDVAPAASDALTPCDKLAFRLASGNNSTLFDHGAGADNLRLTDADLALGFLVYQNFSAGGLSGMCRWSGKVTEKHIKGAPCREQSMLFSILMGNNLLATIWLNLLTMKMVKNGLSAEWGTPAWELAELSRAETSDLSHTFLGHLAPLSRAVKLSPSTPNCILGEGVIYPQLPEWREPMATVKPTRDENPSYVAANPARMPWRDLSSILAIRQNSNRKSALALRHLESLPEEAVFSMWTGGLCAKQAKEIDTVEWKARLSVLVLEESRMQKYENAIAYSETQCKQMISAAISYAEALKMSKVKKDGHDIFSTCVVAERIYWDILAQPENQMLVQDVGSDTYLGDWKKASRKAAEEAYRRACPAMTARQMEAYAQGYSKLTVREED